eukprot:CAMPEP_0168453074 /NCGR_PEP_ID=MMETSP0228-20121227/49495_1 /TAXON_ID=133427 /ORGANISM="Protoceratium reticulatum, Strain CCCM 535 (=CCMP 1889)" /LENGTH=75 /DNA_ID=CAMNT_0008467773 /DNA_START=76 /DNA_END=300 /DNA_ORIENTATION=+
MSAVGGGSAVSGVAGVGVAAAAPRSPDSAAQGQGLDPGADQTPLQSRKRGFAEAEDAAGSPRGEATTPRSGRMVF